MQTRPYGQTGMNVSAVSFGGMRFDNPQNIDANAEVVLHAYSKGINYFDSAPGYCEAKSEEIMGAAIQHMDRNTILISTKSSAADPAGLRKDIETSLKRLKVDVIDVFHIWWVVTLEDWHSRTQGGAVAEAIKAKEEGLIRHLAISSHLPGEELNIVLKEGFFEGVLLGYCAINFPFRDAAVHLAGVRRLGVLTMNPLAGGLIPRNAERFDFLRGEKDDSVVAAALRFNLSNPSVTSALVGFTTKEHVDQACAAVEDFTPYDPGHVERVRENILEKFDGICTGCGYCLPCPKELKIPQLMDAYNQGMLSGTMSVVADRLAMHWKLPPETIKECSQCGECEEKCTQHLPIRERLQEIEKAV